MPKNRRQKRRKGSASPHFIRRVSFWLVLSAGLFVGAETAYSVLNLNWDPTPSTGSATGGGAGNWDATTSEWFNAISGMDQAWLNDGSATAVFGGATAGTVSLNAPIHAAGLTFNSSGYNIAGTGANILTLNGTAAITVAPSISAAISAVVAGTAGVTVAGGGALTLSGANTFTGDVIITDGQLTITNSSGLGVGTKTITILNNSGYGSGELHLNPGAGPAIVLASSISFTTSQSAGPGAIVNDNGNNTINGNFTIGSGGSSTAFGSASGLLTFNGTFTPNSAGQSLFFRGNGGFAVTATNAFVDTAANQLALVKEYGTGTLAISGTSANGLNAGSTLTVNNGAVLFTNAGKAVFTTDTVNGGASLSLDNAVTALNSRLSGKPMILNGGLFTLNGNSGAALTETVSSLTFGSGGSVISLTGAGGLGTTFTATTLTAPASGGSALIQGDNLSSAAGAGNARVLATTFNVLPGQGSGGNGTSTMAIRADILGDNSLTGTGTGFLTKDSFTGNLRALNSGELFQSLATALPTTNAGNFTATQTFSAGPTANSLTLNTTNGIVSTGGGQAVQGGVTQNYNTSGGLNTITLNTGGVLATATSAISGGELTTANNASYVFHVTGSAVLDANTYLAANIGGLTKADGGTLKLDLPTYYTGTTTVNGGTFLLNSGAANTIVVIPTATTPTLQNLAVNGGALDLNGQNQAVGSISNNDPDPNTGGNITSTLAANLITATGNSTTFGGTIGGAISLYKAGAGALTLASANSFSGTTTVQGGGITLQDSGSLASVTINVNGAALTLNNQNTVLNSSRLASAATVNLNSGTLNFNGAGDIIDSTSLATTGGAAVVLNQGSSAINDVALIGAANNPGTTVLTIGNLTRNAGSSVTFGGSNLGQAGVVNNFGIGSSEILLNNVNGAPVSLTNGIIGGWATIAPNVLNGTTNGSATITLNGQTTANLAVGMPVSGGGIPANEFVAGITNSTQFTITTGTGVAANGPGTITVGTTDFAGYVAATGVGALNGPGYAIYTTANLNSAGSADNVRTKVPSS